MTPARFRWGMILVQIGILLLLFNAEVFNDNFFGDLLMYSPVVLIAIGIEKIFVRSRARVISYLSTVGLFLGGFYIAFAGSYGSPSSSFFSESTFRERHNADIKGITAVLNMDNTDLTIRDSGDDLIYGRFDQFTRKPQIDYKYVGDRLRVELASRFGNILGGIVKVETGNSQDWYLKFSDQVPVDLECYGNDADLHMNLSTTPLRSLKLDADDASIYLKLGDMEKNVMIVIDGVDSDLRLRIPTNTGLKILGDDYSGYLKRIGLIRLDGGFVNEGYDTLEPKFEVDLNEELSSFSIDYF